MLRFVLMMYYLSSSTCSELLSRHRRWWIIDSFVIEEGHPGPFPYVLGKINIERQYRVYFDLYGQGVDEEPKGVLSIHKESGTLSVHKAVDYEENTTLKLKFEARKADSSIDTRLGIEITIRDINDNPPRFLRDLYEISIDEEIAQGLHLLTLAAYDRDRRGTPNSTFHYEIKSVSPNTPDTEFFIDDTGTISFKGCLDHAAAEMYTVLVEAKDHGEVVSLSSSTTVIIHIQDGNNHLPSISGQTGTCKVREDETGSSPLQLHVTDIDSPYSLAWRVKYTLQGDTGEHFKIETDPDTNDGILTVVKPFNFEEGAQQELSISVENEVPYFSCTVTERTSSGLWKVDTIKVDDIGHSQTVKVIIEVEDINDPPTFTVAVKEAMIEENTHIGTWIEQIIAVDPDSSRARDFVYTIGHDPAGWVTVDRHTGDITTIMTPDRESVHVVNGVYTVLLHAVDDGEPPLTGTATLNIHVTDQNDNIPQLTLDFLDVCLSDDPTTTTTTTNIEAFDLDDNPFGGPFIFQLLGDVMGKWSLNPSHGYTAGLVKEPGVYSGPHKIDLKISDMQGVFGIYNLSVIICDCTVTLNCRNHQHAATKVASPAICIMFASLILLLFLLLMAIMISCKKEFTTLQTGDSSGETLLASNIEKPGTDCKIPDDGLAISSDKTDKIHPDPSQWHCEHDGMQHIKSSKYVEQNFFYRHYRNKELSRNTWNQEWSTMHILNTTDSSYMTDSVLFALLHRRLTSLQETEELDYLPHCYADEGDSDKLSELENITIPDDKSFSDVLTDLGPKFNQLASICKQPHLQN